MTKSLHWIMPAIIVIVLSGCGGEPRPPIENPRAYAIESLQTMDLNTWWQAYRNPDPVLLERIVDEAVAKRPDDLTTDARKLDTFIRNYVASRYKQYMEDTDEGKAFILAQAEARFANPPIALWDTDGNIALLDYYVLPGEWKSISRLSEGLKNPPVIDTQPFLNPDVLADSLHRLAAAYPDAGIYQIRYQYHAGSDLKKVLMIFHPDRSIVYRQGVNVLFTPEAVAWEDLLTGRIALADLEWDAPMEGYPAPPIDYPPDEPLPSGQ
ncbi:MAG: hypothetical protein H6642_00830 [Caldilineaceae bacterium]|nr:hypothetical protein [Caldilineaceae bacterium]